jgi:hypothetical protein
MRRRSLHSLRAKLIINRSGGSPGASPSSASSRIGGVPTEYRRKRKRLDPDQQSMREISLSGLDKRTASINSASPPVPPSPDLARQRKDNERERGSKDWNWLNKKPVVGLARRGQGKGAGVRQAEVVI